MEPVCEFSPGMVAFAALDPFALEVRVQLDVPLESMMIVRPVPRGAE